LNKSMKIDHHFEEACILLDTATAIWQSRMNTRFADAQKKYDKAIEIYDKYFSEVEEKPVDEFEF
jgi:hypothetical protein